MREAGSKKERNAAEKRIAEWKGNVPRFVYENFGVDPDPWQLDVLKAFPHKQRLAMKACKGPGKTAVLSWCAWNFLATRLHPKVVATSITEDNLKDCLWTEMAKWQNKSPFLTQAFAWHKERITSRNHPETWWMSARTWPKTANREQQANTLAGVHADYQLFILDESGGIPKAVMATAEAGLATGIETKILQAGNPTNLEGPLYDACTLERDLWFLVEITGDPDDPKRSPRVSLQWAREQIQKYGKDNPWVLVNVFGKFPPASINALLGPDECSAASKRFLPATAYAHAPRILGVDVAREGDDKTVLFPRQGLVAFRSKEMRNANTQAIAAAAASAYMKWNADALMIDATGGWGAGAIDLLKAAGHVVFEVQFSGKPWDPRFLNKRAEMWWNLAEWIKGGGVIPPNPTLIADLCAQTYTYSGDKLALIDKDQIKQTLGRSPDEGDALACTFAFPVAPRSIERIAGRSHNAAPEYNPTDALNDYQPGRTHVAEWDPYRIP
ncbi:MAG: hypothetical protein M1377_00630 [Deltaproteobacteria bacterium]|nr:hypothetical protein [Deltaproteobacteria bacterium]